MRNLILLTMHFGNIMHRVTSEQDGCGQTSFSRPDGGIVSPNFRHSSSHSAINCTYFINAGPNKVINLDFLFGELDYDCTREWLKITCNETNDENLNIWWGDCGSYRSNRWLQFTRCPVVQLRYHSDSPGKHGGFSVWYTIVETSDYIVDLPCGDTMFTSFFGIIDLPKENGKKVLSRVNCTYTISIDNPSTISVSFGKSPYELQHMLDSSFVDCNRDYIMIGCLSDGETGLNPNTSMKYCRHINSRWSHNVFPNCRMVKISMRSSAYTYGASYGYSFAVYTSDEDCGNTTSFTGPNGTILSPRFPLSYPRHLDCVYTIDVDRTKTTSLDFLQFNLEGTSKYPKTDVCLNDWLKVICLSDGTLKGSPSREKKYCGKIATPRTLNYSNCDSLTMNFFTDSSVSRDGFQLRYTISTTENETSSETDESCGNTSYSGYTGFITSPRFPLSYPNNLDCVYSIDVDKEKAVILHFHTLNLEGISNAPYPDECIYDWILISCISDGVEKHPRYTWRKKYCGERTKPLILTYSYCESLNISFVTDSSHTSGGFQLKYTVKNESAETFMYGTKGVITSPWYPFPFPDDASGKYSYIIGVGRKSSILLRFIHFDMEMPDSEGHCREWLRITCNETTRGNPNNGKKYCGEIRWTTSLRFVDCSSLELEFNSYSSRFMIEYTATENSNSTNDNSELDCGTTLFTNTSGVISLPRNTKNYLATVNCTYTISANYLSYIWLDIVSSSELLTLLQSFLDCERESLTIDCLLEEETEQPRPNDKTMVLCRSRNLRHDASENRLLIADCRKLQVSIRSTNYDNPETFLIPFHTVESNGICGNTSFSASKGVISTRRLPRHYQRSTNCLYTIDTGYVNSAALVFERLGTSDESCNDAWWTVTCLVNGTSVAHPLADRKLCGMNSSMTARFPACRSVLLNFSSNGIPQNTGFSVRYWIGDYDSECGSTSFNDLNGVIRSPRFPLSYPHNLNCLYSITGGQMNTVSLSFLSLELKGLSNRNSNDSCFSDYLTVSCLSDQFAAANSFSKKKYCGLITEPFKVTFRSCQVVLVNFRSDSSFAEGGFEIRYAIVDKESVCGISFDSPPSGVISFQWNYSYNEDSLDCNYFIHVTKPTSMSFKISSISRQDWTCQRDWLLVTCVNGQSTLDHKISQQPCNTQNMSTQITFASCTAIQILFHRAAEDVEEAFRIEYTINDDGNAVVNTLMNLTGQHGHAAGISLAVVLVVTGAICLGAFLLFRRHLKKKRPQLLMPESAEEIHTLDDLEDDIDTTKAGHRKEGRDTSKYVPLRPMSTSDRDTSSASGNNFVHNEMQPGL